MPRRPIRAILLSAALAAAGCGGDRIRPENEISELRFEKSRALQALRETLASERAAVVDGRVAFDEKEASREELGRYLETVRYLNDQNRKLSAERAELEKTLG